MAAITGTAPVMVPGASPAELALMRRASGAFAERFSLGTQRTSPGQFEQFAQPCAPCPPGQRAVREDWQLSLGGAMTAASEQAAWLTGTLWEAIARSGGTRGEDFRHYWEAYDAGFLATLRMPSGAAVPEGQPVALLSDSGQRLGRLRDADLLYVAYHELPRTLAFGDIGHDDPGSWAGLASSHLTRLADSPLPVTCTVYASVHGDKAIDAHRDTWHGAVIQVSGAMDWRIGDGLLDPGRGPDARITTSPGDILLIPRGMPHATVISQDPGYSVHLAFSIDRDTSHQLSSQATPCSSGQEASGPPLTPLRPCGSPSCAVGWHGG